MIETLYATIDRDELKRLQADANRYRWLREQNQGDAGLGKPFIAIFHGHGFSWWTHESADEKVDAAMLAAQGERHE